MTRILSTLLAATALVAYAAPDADSAAGAAGNEAPALDEANAPAGDAAPAADSKDESVAVNADPNGPLGYLADKTKIKAIHDALGCGGSTRRIVDTMDEATAIITAAAEKTNNFAGLPLVVMEGQEWEGKRVVIATLGMRIKESGTNAIKAVLVFPQPSTDAFVSEAADFVKKLVEREATDTQFGPLRAASTLNELTQAINGIPVDVAGIISSSQSSAMDTSAFDEFWVMFRGQFLKAKPAFEAFIPGKPIVLKAFRSASYASANPATRELESKGYWAKIGQMFVATLKSMTSDDGKPMNIDTSTIESWLAERNTTNLTFNDGSTPSAASLEL